MKRQALAVPVIGLLVVLSGCGFFRSAGAQTTQERDIQGVSSVRLLTSGDLTITVGSPERLTVTAGANQLVSLTSQVIDGTLILDNKSSTTVSGSIGYDLTVSALKGIELSGSGSAQGVGVLAGDATLTVSGSGSANLSGLDLAGIVLDMPGSGGVQLAGASTTQRVTIAGSGDYDGSGLTTQVAEVEVDGSGSAKVNVTEQLSATSSGSGDIRYTGNPPEVQRESTGSGDIAPG